MSIAWTKSVDISSFIEGIDVVNPRILDLGCAHGGLADQIRSDDLLSDYHYIGVDHPYWEQKETTPTPGANRSYAKADAYSLPFEDDSFDLVVASHVLEHLEDIERSLLELRRVTSLSGRLLFIVPLQGNDLAGTLYRYRNPTKYLLSFLSKLGLVEYELPSPHRQFMTFDEYKELFSEYFTLESAHNWGDWKVMVEVGLTPLVSQVFGDAGTRLLDHVRPPRHEPEPSAESRRFSIIGTYILSLERK